VKSLVWRNSFVAIRSDGKGESRIGRNAAGAMKCLVIAAGHGSRLRPVAESKPLAAVKGAPLIEHVIRSAAEGGATEFLVVTGHRAEEVEAFLDAASKRLGLAMRWVRTADWNRPNGHSVITGADRIEGDYLLLMSDHLFDPDIVRRLIGAPRGSSGVTLAVDRRLDNPLIDFEDATKVALGDDGSILRIGKGLGSFDAVDTGIFLATPALREAILRNVARGGRGSLSEGVQRLADGGQALTMDIGSSWWIDVDDPKSLRIAEEQLGHRSALLTGSAS
jgi:choline kinase